MFSNLCKGSAWHLFNSLYAESSFTSNVSNESRLVNLGPDWNLGSFLDQFLAGPYLPFSCWLP